MRPLRKTAAGKKISQSAWYIRHYSAEIDQLAKLIKSYGENVQHEMAGSELSEGTAYAQTYDVLKSIEQFRTFLDLTEENVVRIKKQVTEWERKAKRVK